MSSDPIGDAALMGGLVGLGWGLSPLFLGMGCDRFILGGLGFAVAGRRLTLNLGELAEEALDGLLVVPVHCAILLLS